jgi:hypothetical protein
MVPSHEFAITRAKINASDANEMNKEVVAAL